MKRYLAVALVLLAVDWTLGALQAANVIPLGSFLVLNFPFGLPFVWLESHWEGTRYVLGEGQNISELWSFAAFFFSVFAQAGLYSFLLDRWQRNRPASSAAYPADAGIRCRATWGSSFLATPDHQR